MMKGNFQIITIIVFIALAVLGVFVFSGAIPIGDDNELGALGTVTLWGTVRTATMSPLLEDFNNANPTFVVKYVQKPADSFGQDLLEALASGEGPDMFFLSNDLAFQYSDKIFTIPYTSYPLASFKGVFAGAGEVFLTSDGILALPLTIDPLVMYYNRSLLDAEGIVFPPAFWDELPDLAPKLTKRDDANKIETSMIALGHFANITHAKDIVATLFLQAGNKIISEANGTFSAVLNAPNQRFDLASILKFYTDFADPNQPVYSWNRSFPDSATAFSREDLAFYFGYASELGALVDKNPNQNLFLAPIPQLRGANSKATGARVTGIAVLPSSTNFNTAFLAANLMSAGEFARGLASSLGVAPARRDLLAQKPEDAFSPIFYDSALFAKSWLDPAPRDTDELFREMIDNVLSNTTRPNDAIRELTSKLNFLLIR